MRFSPIARRCCSSPSGSVSLYATPWNPWTLVKANEGVQKVTLSTENLDLNGHHGHQKQRCSAKLQQLRTRSVPKLKRRIFGEMSAL
jgi:hypothetical protein